MTSERTTAVLEELYKVRTHRNYAVAAYWRAIRASRLTVSDEGAKRLVEVETLLVKLNGAIDAAVLQVEEDREVTK